MNELSLFRRDPFAFSFDTQLPRLMRELMRTEEEPRAARFVPSFDVKETTEAYELLADLPGVKPENVDVRVDGNQLSITGKREAETKKEGENFHFVERSYGSFRRVFTLPENAGHEVDAGLKDGVLRVSIPKKPESKPRQINVKAG